MANKDAAGREAGEALKREAKKEERKVEAEKGSDLAKGEKRFEERSRSSDGKSAGSKQL
jgi:hypothetical protein